ncbi:BTB/POZ domain-containing protein 2, partial [Asbolus verrucosus]
ILPKMVIVTNEPYAETEPMLNAVTSEETPETKFRRNSYAEEAYKNITISMKADQLQIEDPNLACKLLSTAVNLKNMPLAKQCIEILDRKLDKNNVLSIFSHLSQCKMPCSNPNDFEPSAPPIVENENLRDKDWVQELTDNLRHNCLLEIDKNSDYILKQSEILNLSYSDLLAIITRDTLEVRSECLVYLTVLKWATKECHRRTLQPHLVNIKAVVRDLRYAPRYGLMSKREFCSRTIQGEKGPTRSNILEEQEWRKIQFYIKEKSKNRPVEELPSKMSQQRVIGTEKPKLLSSQSSIRAMDCLEKNKNTRCNNSTTCDRFLLNFLTCWSAIFD